MFEPGIPNSKHGLHFTFCPFESERRLDYLVPTVGDFVVFRFFTISSFFISASSRVFAGMLNIEYTHHGP